MRFVFMNKKTTKSYPIQLLAGFQSQLHKWLNSKTNNVETKKIYNDILGEKIIKYQYTSLSQIISKIIDKFEFGNYRYCKMH